MVVVFTKFDGQIVNESISLKDVENDEDKWDKARKNADDTFQRVYLPKVLCTQYPPKAYVRLEGGNGKDFLIFIRINLVTDMDIAQNNCPELTEKTADAIDDDSLRQLFLSTQMNNLDLCVEAALQ